MNYHHLTDYYKGKRVFLTGHTGFKGAWLLNWLYLLGAEVKGYSLAPQTENDLYNAIQGDSLCQSIIADILDKKRLEKELLDFEPDFIFHLAAQPLVRLSYEIPSETFAVNAIGTANLLDAIRLLKKPCAVILITTDKVYENREWHYPYRENDRLGGYDPYSSSKACAELIINSYRNSFFNTNNHSIHYKAIAVARAGNVIGGGDWAKDRIVPDIVRALSKEEPVSIRNPRAVRPWQHVLEPLYGYLLLGSRLTEDPIRFADSYNFGPYLDDTLTVEDLVKQTLNSWGDGHYILTETSAPLHEASLLKLDVSKAWAELGWKPKMNSSQALALTIDWYKHFLRTGQAIATTRQQIQEFYEQLG